MVVAQLRTVIVGTDGNIDFVETPDGIRYALGTTSVLQVVAKLVSGQRHRREALDLFNKEGQAAVVLDVDALFDFLAPRRLRWAAGTSLIPHANQEDPLPSSLGSPRQGEPMNPKASFESRLAYIEQQVTTLNNGPDPEALKNLQVAVASITLKNLGDQSDNSQFMNLGQPKVDTVEDPGSYTPPPAVTHPLGKSASFASFQVNTKLAEEIIQHVAETDTKIDTLVTAGRRFNASKARGDLHVVTATLASMMRQVDLAEPWVTTDLRGLSKRAREIHALFASAKV